ncbi:MAG: Bor family protein [Flavobacteriales bacterium]|nr:Bor family protein [Flavobacteriales bacterium]
MKVFKSLLFACAGLLMLSSCYTYTFTVGQGAQGSKEITAWNHYVVYGLAPVGVSDAAELADGAENYTVEVKHSFVNGLIAGLTFGIYTPTMTTVTK